MFQAARRLSCTVSRRASSVYAFFHYHEELRTAKISLLVLVLAAVCWTPFFAVLSLLAFRPPYTAAERSESLADFVLSFSALYYLHCVSNACALAFAALSPYVYVFRSDKVRNCLGEVLAETFGGVVPWTNSNGQGEGEDRCAAWFGWCLRLRHKAGLNRVGGKLVRNRSFSCPSIPNATNGSNGESAAKRAAAALKQQKKPEESKEKETKKKKVSLPERAHANSEGANNKVSCGAGGRGSHEVLSRVVSSPAFQNSSSSDNNNAKSGSSSSNGIGSSSNRAIPSEMMKVQTVV